MTIETDIRFNPRGPLARNGVIRAAHPLTYTKTANGLYAKYRRRVHGFLYASGEAYVPDSASWTQSNSSTGPDLTRFNPVAFLGQTQEGRQDAAGDYQLILHVFGQDCDFRATFENDGLVMTCNLGSSRSWYKIESTDGFSGQDPRMDNVFFESRDTGSTPEVRGWLLEELILSTTDLP